MLDTRYHVIWMMSHSRLHTVGIGDHFVDLLRVCVAHFLCVKFECSFVLLVVFCCLLAFKWCEIGFQSWKKLKFTRRILCPKKSTKILWSWYSLSVNLEFARDPVWQDDDNGKRDFFLLSSWFRMMTQPFLLGVLLSD